MFYKKTTIADFINGSRIKNVLTNYKGNERGAEMLNLKINEALFFDGNHYEVFNVPYLEQYDSKRDNKTILTPKIISVPKSISTNVLKKSKKRGGK